MPSPLPPSGQEPAAPAGINISTVMFGQPWTDPNGDPRFAEQDGVLMEVFHDREPNTAIFMTPESAINLALRVQAAAVGAINSGVDDEGRHPSLAQRIRRIDAAHRGTKN